jgi:hypothetical protein
LLRVPGTIAVQHTSTERSCTLADEGLTMSRFSLACGMLGALLLTCGCGKGEEDVLMGSNELGGKATLQYYGDGDFLNRTVYISVNGQDLGSVGSLSGHQSKDFVFDNANNGKNEVKVRAVFWAPIASDTHEQTFKFISLPGRVTSVEVNVGMFGSITAKFSVVKEGYHPAKIAEEKARQAQATAEQQARRDSQEAAVDAELAKFAKEFVPDLQQAIDKYQEQIKQFTEQRNTFAKEMAKLGVKAEDRPAYVLKKQIIDKMAEDVKRLVADRKETYIRWKELSLLRDTAETKEQRDKLLASAQKAARAAEETFDKYMKQSTDSDAK